MSRFTLSTSPSYPFTSDPGKNSFAIAATVASSSVTLAASMPFDSILLYNSGTTGAWVTLSKGVSASVAPTPGSNQPGLPLAPGATITVSLPFPTSSATAVDTLNVIMLSGTATIYGSPGSGN